MRWFAKGSNLLYFSLFVAALWVAASVALKIFDLGLPARVLIGILPVASLIAQIFVVLRYLQHQDELQRRIALDALAIAFPLGLLGIFCVGFLMRAGLNINLDLVNGGYFMITAFLIGYMIAWRRYQ